MSRKRPDEVRGSSEFASFYLGLDQTSYLCSITKDGIDVLRDNMLAGDKVEKKKWPKSYEREYEITNLFRLDLDRNYRLTYTIVAEGMRKIVCILEVMDHKTYNERFGYG